MKKTTTYFNDFNLVSISGESSDQQSYIIYLAWIEDNKGEVDNNYKIGFSTNSNDVPFDYRTRDLDSGHGLPDIIKSLGDFDIIKLENGEKGGALLTQPIKYKGIGSPDVYASIIATYREIEDPKSGINGIKEKKAHQVKTPRITLGR